MLFYKLPTELQLNFVLFFKGQQLLQRNTRRLLIDLSDVENLSVFVVSLILVTMTTSRFKIASQVKR